MTQRVPILGGSGMLGSMVADYLAREQDLRSPQQLAAKTYPPLCRKWCRTARWQEFDASTPAPRFVGSN